MANEKRLIDKEPIKQFIEDGLNNPDPKKAFGYDAIQILAEIEYAPTVDAVEVVRCQDCKHWKNEINGCTEDKRFCDIGFYMVHKNGFCSFGERKTNEFER